MTGGLHAVQAAGPMSPVLRMAAKGRCFKNVSFETSAFSPTQIPESDIPEIAFAGRSNVGKSSVLNRLFGTRKMVKVSSRPGFTKSLNFFTVDGRFRCVDLPGYGYAKVPPRERERWLRLTDAYLRGGRDIRAVVCLLDMRRQPDQLDAGLFSYLRELGVAAVAVINKADKVAQPRRKRAVEAITALLPPLRHPVFTISARTGEGFEELSYFLCSLVGSAG